MGVCFFRKDVLKGALFQCGVPTAFDNGCTLTLQRNPCVPEMVVYCLHGVTGNFEPTSKIPEL